MASYWDKFKSVISDSIGKAIAAPVESILGLGGGITQNKIGVMNPNVAKSFTQQTATNQQQVRDIATKVATDVVNVGAKPAETLRLDVAFDAGVEQMDKFYKATYPKVARVVTTAELAGVDVLSGEIPNIQSAWNTAKNVSPGQANAALFSETLDRMGLTDIAKSLNVPLPTFLDPNFNIADPEARKKAFSKEIFGKVFSGTADGFFNWYADPLVIGGKALKVGKILGLDRPIQSAEDVVRLRSELDSYGLWQKTQGQIGKQTPMGVIAERLVNKTPEQAYDDIFVRRSNNRTLMANLVGEAKTYDDVADIIAAASGDATSMNKLRQARASMADDIERTQKIFDDYQARIATMEIGAADDIAKQLPTMEEYGKLSKVFDDLVSRDQNLSRAISEQIGDYRLVDQFTSAADVTLFNKNIGVGIEKARGRASELRNSTSFYTETFQKTPFTRAVHVISLPFTKLPRGIVRVDGGPVADSFDEIKAALNSTKALRGPEYINVKNDLARNYLNARNATERYEAVIKVESEIADVIALENGYDLDSAKELYKAFSNVRKGLMNSFQQNGFWVDDATGNLITSPFWKSEMPNVIPMMDFKSFDKFLKTYKFGEFFGKPDAAAKSRQAVFEVEEWFDLANSWFKVSVLTRMGYPIRNTADGQLRAALVLGALAKTDGMISNFAQNMGIRALKAKNYFNESLTVTTPDQMKGLTGGLITARQERLDSLNTILDELTPKNYYAGASGVFGERVGPDMVELAISSKTKPLLTESKKTKYFELRNKKVKQSGLLFGDDFQQHRKLQQEAFGKYVRQEIVPSLPKNTTLVYADYPSGKIFYKVPGKKGNIPSGAYPDVDDIDVRKGLPVGMLEANVQIGKGFKPRAKGPEKLPDIRVVTSYELARKNNFETIASLLGEEQMLRIRNYQKIIDDLDVQIQDKIEQSQKLALARSELKIIRSGEGKEKIVSPSGKVIEVDGAFAGPNGIITRAESSSENTLNWLSENQTYLSFDAIKGAKSKTFKGKLSNRRTVVQPTDPQYFNEVAVFANNILRNDQLAMQILQGTPDTEIARWLKSAKGSFYLREISADVRKIDVEDHIAQARARIYKVFPDQQVRSLIAREEITPEQFDVLLRGQPNLAAIAGRAFQDDTLRYDQRVIRDSINNGISKIFKVIGSTPENNLVAWPFYNKLYLKNLNKEVGIAEGLGKNIQDESLIIQMQRSAHSATLKTVNETLYRVSQNTNISSFMRFVVPFFNAQYNAVKVYGRFFLQDPSRLARASQIWNLPNRTATVVDEEGNTVPPGTGPSTPQFILFTIPEELQGKFGIPKGYKVSVPKNSLNIFLTGENPLSPSFGLPVTIPVAQLSNSRPDKVEDVKNFLNEFVGEKTADVIMNSILPFGRTPENPWQLLVPAIGQKVQALNAGLDDSSYANSVASAMKTLRYTWEQEGRIGKQPDFQDAINLANQIWKIRLGVNMGLPFTFTFRPEYQVIIDDYRRQLQNPLVGRTKIDDYLMAKYGDIGYLVTAPNAKNATSLLPTVSAVRNQREFGSLLQKMDKEDTPGLIGFLANYGATSDEYSNAAANYFKNRSVRPGGQLKYTESRATEDILEDREVSLGWEYYRKFVDQRDAKLAEYGIKSITSSAAKGLGLTQQWEDSVASIAAAYPAWGKAKEFSNTDYNKTKRYVKGLLAIVQDPKWMNKYGQTTTMQALSDFMVNRDYVARELEQRRKLTNKKVGLADEMNADLRQQWESYIYDLKMWDVGFNDLYTRYLENDNYEVIK